MMLPSRNSTPSARSNKRPPVTRRKPDKRAARGAEGNIAFRLPGCGLSAEAQLPTRAHGPLFGLALTFGLHSTTRMTL